MVMGVVHCTSRTEEESKYVKAEVYGFRSQRENAVSDGQSVPSRMLVEGQSTTTVVYKNHHDEGVTRRKVLIQIIFHLPSHGVQPKRTRALLGWPLYHRIPIIITLAAQVGPKQDQFVYLMKKLTSVPIQ